MAANRVYEEGKQLAMAVASTVASGDPVAIGNMTGVALTDYNTVSGKATIDFGGVYNLSVKAVNNAGNVAVAIGDPIYLVAGDTPVLSKKSVGVFFGYALEGITSGQTATIMVRSAGGIAAGNSGVFISAEQTGTGSAQNVAHGLGAAPSYVVVALTEFGSATAVDVAEGSHTATNVVLTVTSGAKFKVIAYR